MAQRIRFDSDEVRAASLGLRIAKTELRKEIYARTRSAITPEWQKSIGEKISESGGNRLASIVLANTARVQVGMNGVKLTSATQSKKLSGGLVPNQNWQPVEFGSTVRPRQIAGRRGQTSYRYVRKVGTQFKRNRRGGYYVFPAGNEMATRYIALWVSTVARTLHDAVEGKL